MKVMKSDIYLRTGWKVLTSKSWQSVTPWIAQQSITSSNAGTACRGPFGCSHSLFWHWGAGRLGNSQNTNLGNLKQRSASFRWANANRAKWFHSFRILLACFKSFSGSKHTRILKTEKWGQIFCIWAKKMRPNDWETQWSHLKSQIDAADVGQMWL